MYNFKIDRIITNNNHEIIPKKVNIIIGPNNCGKSRFLKDIRNILYRNNNEEQKSIIIKDIEYNLPTSAEDFASRYSIRDKAYRTRDGQYMIKNYSSSNFSNYENDNSISQYFNLSNISISSDWFEQLQRSIRNFYEDIPANEHLAIEGDYSEQAKVHTETYIEDIIDGKTRRYSLGACGGPTFIRKGESIKDFIGTYGSLFFNYLGTEEKLITIKCQRKYGYFDPNTNFLSEVQQKRDLLQKLSKETKELFGKDIYLDRYSFGDKLAFRVGDNFDFIRNASREESEPEILLRQYPLLDDEGDGIKGFVANYISLNMDDKNILLLDEPEAFLHPPLARKLGEIIGGVANENKQIFIATHSPEILKGILSRCNDVNIIRITREGNINNIRLLEHRDLDEILKDPLLMASSILNGLFCEKVYLVESDSDERFYQAVCSKANPFDGLYFTHGQNKQTLKRIADVYNKLGVNNARIYDYDILIKDTEFNDALKGCVDDNKKGEYTLLRKQLQDYIEANNIDKHLSYHQQGIRAVDKDFQQNLNKMISDLKHNNIIILRNGCLETTLEDVGIEFTKNKGSWIVSALEKINELTKEQVKGLDIYKHIFQI